MSTKRTQLELLRKQEIIKYAFPRDKMTPTKAVDIEYHCEYVKMS